MTQQHSTYALRVENLEPVRAPEIYDDSELIFVVLPEFKSVVLTEIEHGWRLIEAA
jgi:hypothetical protein